MPSHIALYFISFARQRNRACLLAISLFTPPTQIMRPAPHAPPLPSSVISIPAVPNQPAVECRPTPHQRRVPSRADLALPPSSGAVGPLLEGDAGPHLDGHRSGAAWRTTWSSARATSSGGCPSAGTHSTGCASTSGSVGVPLARSAEPRLRRCRSSSGEAQPPPPLPLLQQGPLLVLLRGDVEGH